MSVRLAEEKWARQLFIFSSRRRRPAPTHMLEHLGGSARTAGLTAAIVAALPG
jgi:hypothetical protein